MSNSKLKSFNTHELLQEILYREATEDSADAVLDLGIGEPITITHAECVALAAAYMQKRSDVVLPEFFTHNAELPDVIAFNRDHSTVIECKVSRSDFLSDKNKSFRQNPNSGMGDFRYYCAPKGIIKPEELPQYWGLIEVLPNGKLRKARGCFKAHKKNIEAEHYLLFYYARRAYYAGVHKTVLDYRGYDG
jgi:hypothetical protein